MFVFIVSESKSEEWGGGVHLTNVDISLGHCPIRIDQIRIDIKPAYLDLPNVCGLYLLCITLIEYATSITCMYPELMGLSVRNLSNEGH